jgi:potassium-transporting ATPase KdpC subunit
MKNQTIVALKFLLIMTIITGIIYPVIITVFSQLVFAKKANGSIISKNGKIIGSELIGQKFDTAIYFWSRPSAVDYNPLPSGGSNLGPSSSKLKKQSEERKANFINKNMSGVYTDVPKEMLFASGSGLDPHISPKAALLQVDRIVKARNFNSEQKQKIEKIIVNLTESPQFFILGEERINVFLLNLELDKMQ